MNISFENLSYKVELGNFWGKKGEKNARHIFIAASFHLKMYFRIEGNFEKYLWRVSVLRVVGHRWAQRKWKEHNAQHTIGLHNEKHYRPDQGQR